MGNNQYKTTSNVHHAIIHETEHSENNSLNEITQSGECRKKIGDYRIIKYN